MNLFLQMAVLNVQGMHASRDDSKVGCWEGAREDGGQYIEEKVRHRHRRTVIKCPIEPILAASYEDSVRA